LSEESRLGREQIETAYILKRILDAGVRVFFYLEDRERTLDNPMDKIVLSLQHFASEMERERARLRTYDAMARKAQAGHVTGGRVYGYDNVDVFAPDLGADGRPRRMFVSRRINETQAPIVRRIFMLCSDGYGLTKIAEALNADRIAPPRGDGNGWAPTAVRELLHRELYRGVIVWNRSQKIMRGGTRKQRKRPVSEWLRRPAEELRIISDTVWEAAHRRLARTRNTFGPGAGRSPAPLGLMSPYLLSGLGRCALCGGSIIAISRHHGRRRGFFYGCAYNSKRGPTVCRNNLHMRQETLENAVIDSVAAGCDDAEVSAAIERALELVQERREGARENRRTHEEALRAIRAEEARLIDAVKQGHELNALVVALHKAQERRQTLEHQVSSTAIDRLPDPGQLRARLMKRAAEIRRVLDSRGPEVRRVLQAVVTDRLDFAPFNHGALRGYQFSGTGSYGGELLGDTCPTSNGGPNGIRT
jgi:site-specific DNA recombinase